MHQQFYQLIFELSEGYFFIDQILPFFSLSEFENLYLTSKYISQLVMKQRHVNYNLVHNYNFSNYYNNSSLNNKYRWLPTPTPPVADETTSSATSAVSTTTEKINYPSLLHFVNGIKIAEHTFDKALMDSIIEFCKKEHKLFNINFECYVYTPNYWDNFESPQMKNLTQFGILKVNIENYANFLQFFENKNVKRLEIRESYSNSDLITTTAPVVEKINYEELHFSFSGYHNGSLFTALDSLDNRDSNYINRMSATFSSYTIYDSDYPKLQKYANIISNKFKFNSFIILSSSAANNENVNDHCKFEVYSDTYQVSAHSLTKIDKFPLPTFSNPRTESLQLICIDLPLTSQTVNTFHLLKSTRYLTSMVLERCSIDFSNVDHVELKSLTSLTLDECTFLKNGKECSLEFIECLKMPLLKTLQCAQNLTKIPLIHSERLVDLRLSKNQIETIELEKLTIHPSLTRLNLSNNKLNDLSNVQSIVGKYKMLNLENNPFLNRVQIVDNQLVPMSGDVLCDVTRSKKLHTKPHFTGSDSEIIKQFKRAIREATHIPEFASAHSFYTKKVLLKMISNPKKPKLFTATNIVFWNNFYNNDDKSISSNGCITTVDGIVSYFTQIAVRLNSTLSSRGEWLFFGLSGSQVHFLNDEKLRSQLSYIVHEWSFVSSHIDHVMELRRQYPTK